MTRPAAGRVAAGPPADAGGGLQMGRPIRGRLAHWTGRRAAHRRAPAGVVDVDCRVHGVAGPCAAGSPASATAGRGNPTLMRGTLADRWTDRSAGRLAASPAGPIGTGHRLAAGVA